MSKSDKRGSPPPTFLEQTHHLSKKEMNNKLTPSQIIKITPLTNKETIDTGSFKCQMHIFSQTHSIAVYLILLTK